MRVSRHDMERFARLSNVLLAFPPVFPFSSVTPNRAFYWFVSRDPALARALASG